MKDAIIPFLIIMVLLSRNVKFRDGNLSDLQKGNQVSVETAQFLGDKTWRVARADTYHGQYELKRPEAEVIVDLILPDNVTLDKGRYYTFSLKKRKGTDFYYFRPTLVR